MMLSRPAIILFSIVMTSCGVKAQTMNRKGTKTPTAQSTKKPTKTRTAKPTKSPSKACNDENGYEVWRILPPADAKVRFEGQVDCDTKTYTLTYSFEPDKNLPFINNITKADWNGDQAHPEKAAVCLAEGLGPGLQENVPVGTHVGLNTHFTEYTYTYEISKRFHDATGFKLLTVGAAPCGSATQPYPHYSMHFFRISVKDREKMRCRSNRGYFCEPATEQCSKSGREFNLDGVGLEMCDDGVTYANVPAGFRWTIDGNLAIGINAASPGMGLHGLVPADLAGSRENPLLLMVQYDSTIVANHLVIWGGLPLGQNNPGSDFRWSKNSVYNCHDTVKYPSLPVTTSVAYIAAEGRTYMTIEGPTSQCRNSFSETWSSTTSAPSTMAGNSTMNETVLN